MFERTEANQKWQARIKQVLASFFIEDEGSEEKILSPDNHLSYCTAPSSLILANHSAIQLNLNVPALAKKLQEADAAGKENAFLNAQ